MFDTDFGLGLRNANTAVDTVAFALQPDGGGWPNPPWSTELLRMLVLNPTFQTDFINRYADYLNTVLKPEVTRPILEQAAATIRPEMPRQLGRWGSEGVEIAQQMVAWENLITTIGNWLQTRPTHAWTHLATNFNLAGTFQLDLDVDPPGSGSLQLTAVVVETPFTGTYFHGVPVTITAVPAEGFEFAGWSDVALPQVPTIRVTRDADTSITARFQ